MQRQQFAPADDLGRRQRGIEISSASASSIAPAASIARKRASIRSRRSVARHVEHEARQRQSVEHRLARVLLPERQRAARRLEHFLGAQHALAVAGVELRRHDRIAPRQFGVERLRCRSSRSFARAASRTPAGTLGMSDSPSVSAVK